MSTSMVIEASTSIAWLGRVDAEGPEESPPSQRGDDDGLALLHPLNPAEIEVAPGHHGPDRTCDMRASLGPIEAESTNVAAGRTQPGWLDPEFGENTGAGWRDFGRFLVEHDVVAGNESIGEIDAEAAGEVIVANSGRTERACFTG